MPAVHILMMFVWKVPRFIVQYELHVFDCKYVCMCVASLSSRWVLESYLSMLYKITLDWRVCVCSAEPCLEYGVTFETHIVDSLVCRLAVRVRRWVSAALLSSTRHCSASSLRSSGTEMVRLGASYNYDTNLSLRLLLHLCHQIILPILMQSIMHI